MSYILDALKKADAERERDAAAVPDLHAQADAARGTRAAARPSGWLLTMLAAAAIALAALAWRWFDDAPVAAAPPAVIAQAPTTTPVAPPSASAAVPAMPVAAAPGPAPAQQVVPVPAARALNPAPPPRSAVTTAAAPAAPLKTAPAASAAAEARLLALAELPPNIRSQLPALVVGGSVYSPNPASRIVILNGQVFREGDKPVDGLAIEQIRLKSTVLAFRELRFEIKH